MRYEIYPKGEQWGWKCNGEGEEGYATRTEAYDAARAHRGDVDTPLYTKEGNYHKDETIRGGSEAIVLLREDGSLHGELQEARGEGGTPQFVDIEPATESSEVG